MHLLKIFRNRVHQKLIQAVCDKPNKLLKL
jgi:hypothetical protein